MGKINLQVFRREATKAFNTSLVRDIAIDGANKALDRAKNIAIKEFNNHPVTRELRGGPEAQNVSNTLGGRGNLFSFIGFMSNDDPTRIVERAILDSRLNRTPSIRRVGKSSTFTVTFVATVPSKKQLEAITPMPFEKGRSWLTGIERGISGLSYYIYNKVKGIKGSRSGKAIQSKHPYMSGLRYKPTSYISPILNNLRKRLITG
jgi:hypothetical protein